MAVAAVSDRDQGSGIRDQATPCLYGAVQGVDPATKKGPPGLLRKCNLACDPGETLCPRHKLIAQLEAQKRAAKKGVRTPA